MDERCDIAIVGAGAAGLAAGIFAAQAAIDAGSPCRILLLDGAKTIGAKILVSGGGRCNVTHDRVAPHDYFTPRPFVKHVLSAFDADATVRWMRSLGVELKREPTGKLFPVTDSAKTVLAALLGRLGQLGVEVRPLSRVADVRMLSADACSEGDEPCRDGRFVVDCGNSVIRANRVVLCTGGRSLPRTGSDGGGWAIARRLGHAVTDTSPALVPLVLEAAMFHEEVSGLSHEAELSTIVRQKRVDRRGGSLLWTHFGISGPLAMDASRFWTLAVMHHEPAEMRCSFVPGVDFEQAERKLLTASTGRPRAALGNVFAEHLPERLRHALIRRSGNDPAQPIGQLPREGRRALIHALTALPLPIVRDRGWNYAEVTTGGVPLEEVDFRTMQSRRVPGLYLAGEILDCDGRIGGFNFQWAWASGFLAGNAAVRSASADRIATPAKTATESS